MPAQIPTLVEARFPAAALVERWQRAQLDREGVDEVRDFLVGLSAAELRAALAGHDFALAAEPRFNNRTLERLAGLAEHEQLPLHVGWWRGSPLVLLPASEPVRDFLEPLPEIPFAEAAYITLAGRETLWLSWNY